MATPDYLRYYASEPNDPDYSTVQWHLRTIGAPAAWDRSTGSTSVRVCLIDSGVPAQCVQLCGCILSSCKGLGAHSFLYLGAQPMCRDRPPPAITPAS